MNMVHWLLELLYPSKCIFCRQLLDKEERYVCGACAKQVQRVENGQKRGEFYEICHCVYQYDDMVARAIQRFKFGDKALYAIPLGEALAQCLTESGEVYDLVTWVPVSKKRKRRRGYDQAELLAKETARHLKLPCFRTLRKNVDNRAQATLSGVSGRKANVFGVYETVKNLDIEGKRVLLIDDVLTTGATLSECSRMLKIAGAAAIFCGTAAAAMKKDDKKCSR